MRGGHAHATQWPLARHKASLIVYLKARDEIHPEEARDGSGRADGESCHRQNKL